MNDDVRIEVKVAAQTDLVTAVGVQIDLAIVERMKRDPVIGDDKNPSSKQQKTLKAYVRPFLLGITHVHM